MSVTIVTSAGNINVTTARDVLSAAPSGWDDQIAEYGRGYNYPLPTGQTTVYRIGDDADIEATIFAPVRVANSLKVKNSLVDYETLGNNSSFGNTVRFSDDLGTEIFSSSLMIDNYTGLMWYRNFFAVDSGGFDSIIDAALASTQGGFSDWFLPSTSQQISIMDNGNPSKVFFKPLGNNTFNNTVLSSTTLPSATTSVMRFNNQIASLNSTSKTGTLSRYYICRKHF